MIAWGLKTYFMVWAFARRSRSERWRTLLREKRFERAVSRAEVRLPQITTQIPIYNELNVAERVIRAVASMDYPKELHEIQILDDSNDETVGLVDSVCQELRRDGFDAVVLRRARQEGFKAGALKEGMRSAKGEFIAIFDADFVPPKDFLWRCLAQFQNRPKRALVQARWGHLNRNKNRLTEAVAIGIDGHFVIEQPARSWNELFLNFNGTAGLWRRSAIDDAGGWKAITLTEDLELSYRVQLMGSEIFFHHDLVVPAEIPANYTAFKSQQFRWAKGSIQTALLTLPRLFKARLPTTVKLNALLHLTQYCMHGFMLLVAILSVPILYTMAHASPNLGYFWMFALVPIAAASIGPSQLYVVSQIVQGRSPWKTIRLMPYLILIGFGISVSNTVAVLEAIRGVQSPFVRTPKEGQRVDKSKTYRVKRNKLPWLETAMGLYTLGGVILALTNSKAFLVPYLILYSVGFFTVGISSLRERQQKSI